MSAARGRARALFSGSDPLVRASDRAEAWVLVVFVLLGLLAFPMAAAAGSEVYAHETALSAREHATRHQASAVLTADAPHLNTGARGIPGVEKVLAPARWIAPDGTERTGDVPAAEGALAGARVPVWLDQTGDVVRQPRTGTGAAITGAVTGFALWAGAVCLCALGFLGLRWALDRSRYARWEREWESVERDWTRH